MLGTEKQWRCIYYLYGVGMPVLFLIIILIAEHVPGDHIKPNMGATKCWFDGKEIMELKKLVIKLTNSIVEKKATYLYFYGPIATILCVNMILFVWTSIALWKKIPHERNNQVHVMRYK